jgi:hypothetical protein
MPTLSDNYDILCHNDGSICSIEGAYLCPDFPAYTEELASAEIRQHIRASGLSVERLLIFASTVHALFDGQHCRSDTIATIAEALTEQLGLKVRDPFFAASPSSSDP